MNLIKTIIFIFLFVLCSSVSFAGIRDRSESSETTDQLTASLSDKRAVKTRKSNTVKQYAKAREAYFSGDIYTAEKYLEEILSLENNEKAYDLKNKIMLLNEKMAFLKREIVNDYMVELKKTVRDSNYYDGFLYIRKIMEIAPLEDVSYSKSRLEAEKNMVEDMLDSDLDKALFNKSLKYFVAYKYYQAKDIIESLAQKYPRFITYKNTADMHIIEEHNSRRLAYYYREALENANKKRLLKAKDFIDLAYSLDPRDIKVLTLMEQINLEMM